MYGIVRIIQLIINEFRLSMNMLDNSTSLKYIMSCNCGVNFDFQRY